MKQLDRLRNDNSNLIDARSATETPRKVINLSDTLLFCYNVDSSRDFNLSFCHQISS